MNDWLSLQRRHERLWLAGLALAVLLAVWSSLFWGPVSLADGFSSQGLTDLQRQILLQLRLPRVILALLLGAGLAMSGCVLQTLLHNPLAEPGLIGVSSGASLCAVVALFVCQRLGVFLPVWGVSLAAFAGAILITLCLLALARAGRLDNVRLLLLGVALGMASSALTTWLLYFANDSGLREILFWMMGSLAYGQFQPGWWWLPYLGTLYWLLRQRKALNLMQLGEQQARLMGLNIARLRWQLVLAVCLLSGLAVALAGTIGFVGLVIPHLMRLLSRSGMQFLLPASMLGGALILLLADMLARNLIPVGELPVGILTASLGAPILIGLLVRRHA